MRSATVLAAAFVTAVTAGSGGTATNPARGGWKVLGKVLVTALSPPCRWHRALPVGLLESPTASPSCRCFTLSCCRCSYLFRLLSLSQHPWSEGQPALSVPCATGHRWWHWQWPCPVPEGTVATGTRLWWRGQPG